MMMENPVGILDSGAGGISVLRALIEFLPHENFIYYGDSAHNPYGTKTREEILSLTMRCTEILLEKGCKTIVVACNTATAAAITELREKYPEIPMIGLEPALKPAVLHKPDSTVIVMATPFTLKEKKFRILRARYENQANIISLPCPDIVGFVEREEMHSQELKAYLRQQFAPYMDQRIDAIVLGCTHFPFVRGAIREIMGDEVVLFDSAMGVGRQVKRQLKAHSLLNPASEPGKVEILNSKGPEGVALCRRLLGYSV